MNFNYNFIVSSSSIYFLIFGIIISSLCIYWGWKKQYFVPFILGLIGIPVHIFFNSLLYPNIDSSLVVFLIFGIFAFALFRLTRYLAQHPGGWRYIEEEKISQESWTSVISAAVPAVGIQTNDTSVEMGGGESGGGGAQSDY